jgi:hypothetical protein
MISIWIPIVAAYLLIGAALAVWVEGASETPFTRDSLLAFLTLVFLWPHLLLLAILEITVGIQ